MAVLNSTIRQALCDEFAKEVSAIRGSLGNLTKAELRAVINACDQWADDNTASFNSSLPQPGRSALTSSQKAQILANVILRRYKENV